MEKKNQAEWIYEVLGKKKGAFGGIYKGAYRCRREKDQRQNVAVLERT